MHIIAVYFVDWQKSRGTPAELRKELMSLIIQFFDIKLTLNRCAGIFNIAVSFPRFDVTIIPVYVENHVFPA